MTLPQQDVLYHLVCCYIFADKLQTDDNADYIMAQLHGKFYHVKPTQVPDIDLETTQILLQNTPYGSILREFFS